MNGTLFGVIAAGLVILSLLIWMNVAMIRGRSKKTSLPDAPQVTPATVRTETAQVRRESENPHDSSAPERPYERREAESLPGDREAESELRSSQKTSDTPSPIPIQATATRRVGESVEVLSESNYGPSHRVFERPTYPFVLKSTTVPMFTDETWMNGFRRLTEDRHVLGWIAFAGETLGASDREYESGFVDVIRNYLRALEKVRREVGLTNLHETSITAEEGKVWCITAKDDVWFALFVERDTNLQDLTSGLLGGVLD